MAGNRIEAGLANLGNTCFMNASLQLLLHVEPLVSYFISGNFQNDLNTTSGTKGEIAVSFAHLVRQITSHDAGTAISPVHFQKAVGAFAPYLMDYQQQDCQEFLRFILDGLGEDLKRVHKSTENVSPPDCSAATTVPITIPGDTSNVSLTSVGCSVDKRDDGATLLTPSTSLPSLSDTPPPTTITNLSSSASLNSSGGIVNKLRNLTLQAGQSLSLSLRSTGSDREKQGQGDENCEDVADSNVDDKCPRQLSSLSKPQPEESTVEFEKESGSGQEDIDKVLLNAAKSWQQYVNKNDSIVTDLFAGLLQSTVECCQCHNRSYTFDPFLDLSVPIPTAATGKSSNVKSTISNTFNYSKWHSGANTGHSHEKNRDNCTLEECLQQFTGEEVLDGDNMVTCDKCKQKQKSVKKIMILKYPKILVIHLNRFRYNSLHREKLSTDVKFPLNSLDLTSFLQHPEQGTNEVFNDLGNTRGSSMSKSSPLSPKVPLPNISTSNCTEVDKGNVSIGLLKQVSRDAPVYDLAGISNHSGSIHGGHYVAHVDTNNGNRRRLPGAGAKETNALEPKMPNILPSSSLATNANITLLSPPSSSHGGGHGEVEVGGNDGLRGLSDEGEEVVVASTSPRWMCFNDTRVSSVSTTSIGGPSAYVLFYNLVPVQMPSGGLPPLEDAAITVTTPPVTEENSVAVGRSDTKKKRKDQKMSQSPGLFSATAPLPSAGRVKSSTSPLDTLHGSLPQSQFPSIGQPSSSSNRMLPSSRPVSNILAV